MNENLEILQKDKGNKRTIRFLSYLGILVFSKIICFKNVMKIPKKYQKKIEKSSRLHEKTSLSGPWQRIQGILEQIISTFRWVKISKFSRYKMETKKLSKCLCYFRILISSKKHQKVSNAFIFFTFRWSMFLHLNFKSYDMYVRFPMTYIILRQPHLYLNFQNHPRYLNFVRKNFYLNFQTPL